MTFSLGISAFFHLFRFHLFDSILYGIIEINEIKMYNVESSDLFILLHFHFILVIARLQ